MAYTFNVYDYLVLSFVLGFSILIGFYHAIASKYGSRIKRYLRRNKPGSYTTKTGDANREMKDYLIGGGQISGIPIAFSLLASFFSATALLGLPAEVYQYGIEHWLIVFGIMVTPIFGAFLTGPMFRRLKLLSVFEYLKMRYNSNHVRLLATSFYIIRATITTAIFIYGPATTLTALTTISTPVAIIIIGGVATFYTTIGGIKAVIWTDFFQLIIMFCGLVALICVGVVDVGGLNRVWQINYEGGRLNLFDFNPNPFTRQTFWSLVFGIFVFFWSSYCIDQAMVQRFSAAKSQKQAQIALLLNVPGVFLLVSLCCFSGLVLYANYATCDPLSAPSITNVRNPNQLMVYLVTDKMKAIKGFTGLFVSAILSGSLSSVSSALNSMAAIVWEDFFKRINYFNKLDDKHVTYILKALVIVIGVIATGLAIIVSGFGGNLVQISNSLNGALGSPITGVFLLAGLVPFSNVYGALSGMVAGLAMGVWVSYGAFVVKPDYPKLDVNADCYKNATSFLFNSTLFDNFTTAATTKRVIQKLGKEATNLKGFEVFYSLSFNLFAITGILTTVIVGIIVSLATRGYRTEVDPQYLLLKCLGKRNKNPTVVTNLKLQIEDKDDGIIRF